MTIYDIAKLAGVSKSTVSRVLNGETNVSSTARESVERVVRENNYVPSRSASMTKKKREVILVLVTRLDSYSETRFIRGMMEVASDEVEFLIIETQFSLAKTKQIIENNNNVNAIIVFAISGESYDFLSNSLQPVVIVGQNVENARNNIYFQDYNAMCDALNNIDARKPLFIGYDENDITMKTRYDATRDWANDSLEKIETVGFNKLPSLANVKLDEYNQFICATEKLALYTYKHLLKSNHDDYQIISVGNNTNINFVIENLTTIDFHYKSAGSFVFNQLTNNQEFDKAWRYSVLNVD